MTSPQHPLATMTRLSEQPGHFVRRLNQIVVGLFMQETEAWRITPVQYASMQTVFHHPDLDQRTLARTIGFDTSTITGVIDRLEARGLMKRTPSGNDRRVRLISLTKEGKALLEAMLPSMRRSQERFLAPLSESEQDEFMRLMRKVVYANNEMSRAPGGGSEQAREEPGP